jgi:hypothetical protein
LDEDPNPEKVTIANLAVAIDDGVVIGREDACTPASPICGGIWWEVAWNAETLELYGDGTGTGTDTDNHPWFTDLDGPHLVGATAFGEDIVSQGRPSV